MNQHPLGQHFNSCSSPDNCAEYASILTMTPAEQSSWILADQQRIAGLRSASARTHQFRVSQVEDFTPPDAFAPDIAARKVAEATPASTFEDRWKAERLAEYSAEYARADAERAAPRPAPITDSTDYSAPSAYAEGIARLQKEMK